MTPFPGRRCAIVEININFLNTVRAGMSKFSAEVVKRGKSIGLVQAKVTHGERLVRKTTGTSPIA